MGPFGAKKRANNGVCSYRFVNITKMQAVDCVLVARHETVENCASQVFSIFWAILRRRKREKGLGTKIARVGDWRAVIGASELRLVLLSAREEKLSARTFGLRSRQAPRRGRRPAHRDAAVPTKAHSPPCREEWAACEKRRFDG